MVEGMSGVGRGGREGENSEIKIGKIVILRNREGLYFHTPHLKVFLHNAEH